MSECECEKAEREREKKKSLKKRKGKEKSFGMPFFSVQMARERERGTTTKRLCRRYFIFFFIAYHHLDKTLTKMNTHTVSIDFHFKVMTFFAHFTTDHDTDK